MDDFHRLSREAADLVGQHLAQHGLDIDGSPPPSPVECRSSAGNDTSGEPDDADMESAGDDSSSDYRPTSPAYGESPRR